MPEKLFIGSDGNWGIAGNWNPPGVPVSNDIAILNGYNDVAITSGLSQGAVDLDLLWIDDTYTSNIGTSSTALTILADKIVHRGKGTLYLARGSGLIDEILIAHTGSAQNLAMLVAGPISAIVSVSRGRVSMPSLGDFDIVDLAIGDADVTLGGGIFNSITNLRQIGGRLVVGDGFIISRIAISGGELLMQSDSTPAGSEQIHISGGIVKWEGLAGEEAAPAISIANIYGGILDLTTTGVGKTIDTIRIWPNGKLHYFPDLTTFTNPIQEFDGRSVAP